MKRIWAFDNRTGAVNEAVTLGHRPRTTAQAGLEAFRHPRIRVGAGGPGAGVSARTRHLGPYRSPGRAGADVCRTGGA